MREKVVFGLAAASALLLAYNLYHIFLVLPDEAMQGPIYRIIFFHVPAAITGMIGYFIALVLSILYLSSGNFRYDSLAASVVEVSVVFSVLNIVTGSIGPDHLGHLVDLGLPPYFGSRLCPHIQRLFDAASRHRRANSARSFVSGACDFWLH